jgi:predicted DCC family thiol-disulfide oxidoreductase YuxK
MLYDGSCGLCAASVQFILRHERRGTLRFAALESSLAAELRTRHPELAGVDSMVWIEGLGGPSERVAVRARAVLAATQYLGGAWRLASIARLLPVRLLDAAYDLVAHHRHRLVPTQNSCYLPPPAVRSRFIG